MTNAKRLRPATASLTGLAVLLVCIACESAEGVAPVLLAQSELRYEIAYATFFGGPFYEEAREVIAYPDGSVLVGMEAKSAGLPTSADAFQKSYAGDDPRLGHGGVYGGDYYLLRLSADGSRMLAGSYLGGSKQDRSTYGLALDDEGNVVVAGMTRSPDFPTTAGAFQPEYGGGKGDWVVAKLSADLDQLLWATYLGGSQDDSARGGLGLDAAGNVYVVGETNSPDFPARPGPTGRHSQQGTAAMVVLGPDGSYQRGSLLGGSGREVIVGVRARADGTTYLGGYTTSPDFPVSANAPQSTIGGKADLFLTVLSPQGELNFSTFFGGAGNEFSEHRLALDPDGTMLQAAFSGSKDFPATPGAFQSELHGKGDGALVAVNAEQGRVAFATLIGGSGSDVLLMPSRDAQRRILVSGNSSRRDFPITAGAVQERFGGGDSDGTVTIFSPDGSRLVYSTFLGGSGKELVRSATFGPDGSLYLVGRTDSEDFPVTPGALQTRLGGQADSFVVKLVPSLARDSEASD